MPRRNSRVQRSKDRKRLARKAAEDVGIKRAPRTDVTRSIIPIGQCGRCTPRRYPVTVYGSKAEAEQALKNVQAYRARTGALRVEKGVVPCAHLGGWRLTAEEQS